MKESQNTEYVELLCLRCGHANNERASRCIKCKSPLGNFASSSPWEMGTATGSAYSHVINPRSKPIIFWGAWLYFGPSAIGSLWYILHYIYYLYFKPLHSSYSPELKGGVILALMFTALYGVLSIWVLWFVSKGYLRPSKKLAEQDVEQKNANPDKQPSVLNTDKYGTIADGACAGPQCPSCGSMNTSVDSVLRSRPSILGVILFGWMFMLVRGALRMRSSVCRDCAEVNRYKSFGSWVALVILVLLIVMLVTSFLAE